MKIKLSGSAAQVSGVLAPGVLLTLSILRLNSVPEPDSGVKSMREGRQAERPNRSWSRQNVRRHVPIPGGESSFLHKQRAGEGADRLVKGEITLEANVTEACVDVRDRHRLEEDGGEGN